MKIIFDARPVKRRMHGIARFAVETLKAISKLDSKNEWTVIALEEGKENLPSLPENFEILFVNLPPYNPLEHVLIPYFLRKKTYDIYFPFL